jgi:hypothetical protein
MADETATLFDTVANQDKAEAEVKVEAKAEPETPPTPVTNPEALEIGELLLAQGVTKDKINDVLAAPQALEALRFAIQNNPDEFMAMLERSDPKTAEKFLDRMTDRYVKMYGDEGKGDKSKPEPNADLMREVKALRERVESADTREAQRNQQMALAATRQRLDARVDDLLGLKEVKELGLTKSEAKAMRAQLDVTLSQDPSVVQRVSNGNFVDVPRVFKGILDEWSSDKKAAIEAATKAREKAEKGSFGEFQNGPEIFARDIPSKTFDSWDATEEGFAQALMGR